MKTVWDVFFDNLLKARMFALRFQKTVILTVLMNKTIKLSLCAILLSTAQLASAQLQDINLQLRSTMTFPGQTLANVCGYWQNGQEYALLGGSNGMIIVDITNPDVPQQIVQIPSPEGSPNNGSLWKEIKVYKQFAYLVTEAGGGIQIIDLSALPSPNLSHHLYKGDGAIAGQLNDIHALHIDVTKGFLYAYGGGLFGGAAKVFDLNSDPNNPRYVGRFIQEGYIHDGYVDNDTLYACHINSGIMSIVDMKDKANPVLLGTVETPGKFTHNSWMTSDRKHVLTTDETTPSFLAAYDVSDPSDIKELDRLSPNNGTGTYVHNTHIVNDYAVTSWYTSGVLIVDAHRPQNLITVAQYDTYTGNNLEFEGCWGAFPFFPSGTVITTNITPGILTVLSPTYKRACYLEGKITNACNGQALIGATVKINGSTDPVKMATTRADGLYRTGQVTPGNFTATIKAPGYPDKTVNITLATGQVTILDVVMDAGAVVNAKGVVIEQGTLTPIPNATVILSTSTNTFTTTSNASGQFNLDCIPAGVYTVSAGKWGYIVKKTTSDFSNNLQIQLVPGYYDDFKVDLGWTVQNNAEAGDWVRETPEGTYSQGNLVNPDNDVDLDDNTLCYMTANGGGQPGSNDVDNGMVSLISPVMKLSSFQDPILSFYYWFFNAPFQNNPANDLMEVNILNGNQTINVLTQTASQSAWRFSGNIYLKDYVTPLSDNVRIEFLVNDLAPGNWLEGAVDIFKVEAGAVRTATIVDPSASILVAPNPSASAFSIQYAWEQSEELPVLEIRNLLGQMVYTENLSGKSGVTNVGTTWTSGLYFASLRSSDRSSQVLKLVKQ